MTTVVTNFFGGVNNSKQNGKKIMYLLSLTRIKMSPLKHISSSTIKIFLFYHIKGLILELNATLPLINYPLKSSSVVGVGTFKKKT